MKHTGKEKDVTSNVISVQSHETTVYDFIFINIEILGEL